MNIAGEQSRMPSSPKSRIATQQPLPSEEDGRRFMPPIEELLARQKNNTVEQELVRIRNAKIPPPPPRHVLTREEIRRDCLSWMNINVSLALEHYNNGKNVKFELVEGLDFSNFMRGFGLWTHISFKAKAANAQPISSSPKLFFAEINRRRGSVSVTCCRILDPTTDKVIGSCGYCIPDRILHPGDGMQTDMMGRRLSGRCIQAMKRIQERKSRKTKCPPGSCLPLENTMHPLGAESKGGTSETESANCLIDKSSPTQRCKDPPESMLLPQNDELMSKLEGRAPHSIAESEVQTQTSKQKTKFVSASEMQALMKTDTERATIALELYKEEKKVEFELVEAGVCVSFYNGGHYWYHMNFKAKPKDAPDGDSSLKIFFGELFREYPGSLRATCCCILDLIPGGVCDDCGHCPLEVVAHPGNGMRVHVGSFPGRGCGRGRGRHCQEQPSRLWSAIRETLSEGVGGA